MNVLMKIVDERLLIYWWHETHLAKKKPIFLHVPIRKRAQNAVKLVFLWASKKPSLKNYLQDAYKIGDFFFSCKSGRKVSLKSILILFFILHERKFSVHRRHRCLVVVVSLNKEFAIKKLFGFAFSGFLCKWKSGMLLGLWIAFLFADNTGI